jgi:peroxiredoxin
MTDTALLRAGDQFPALTVAKIGGGTLRLPDELAGHLGVILFYRGSWCPYCNAQLSAFQRALDELNDNRALVAALSVDQPARSNWSAAPADTAFAR